MGKFGSIVRSRFPAGYYFVVGIINYFIRVSKPYSIYITDNLGGSFKEYFLMHNMPSQLMMLKNGLDEESVKTIDTVLERFLNYPDERYKQKISKSKPVIGGLLPVESDLSKNLINKELIRVENKYPHFSPHIEESVFYFFHGLGVLPEKIADYIRSSDFMDIGAFIGDSSVALFQYQYNRIFAVELSKKSIGRYCDNMKRSGISESRFEVIHAAISGSESNESIKIKDTGSAGLSNIRNTGKYDEIEVPLKTLDRLVSEKNIKPKFIKVDIEGNGYRFVQGAVQTIRQFRPVLSIAIYHNPQEFFEVKPFLEEIAENYVFMIRKLSAGIRNNQCHSEIVLLGYPGEILD
jgi:FkbM family methyltransferase